MSKRTCAVEGCARPSRKRNWCSLHYARWARTGDPGPVGLIVRKADIVQRFWSKVVKTETCWLWTAYVSGKGYGQFRMNGRMHAAHQVALLITGTPRPLGAEVDHLCRVRHCVNPAHLEWVTHAKNMERAGPYLAGPRPDHYLTGRTHCKNGHEFSADNTRHVVEKDGSRRRRCRVCQNEANLRHRAKRKASKP